MDGIEAIVRWMHIFVGILWIGHLYYFNFVNGQMVAKLDAAAKKQVVPELMPRALYWFRWGAAWTWITGVLLLILVYYAYVPENLSADGWRKMQSNSDSCKYSKQCSMACHKRCKPSRANSRMA